jgi:hypothetical protein
MAKASKYRSEVKLFPSHADDSAGSVSMHSVRPHYSRLPGQSMQDRSHSDANISAYEPLHPSTHSPERLENRKLEKLKRIGRLISSLSELLSTLFSLAMFVLMVYVMVEFLTTKDTFREGRTPWAKNSKVWPAIMLLAASAVTLITSAVILCAYCCCFKRARASWKITLAIHAVQTVSWIVVAVIYRYQRGLNGKNNDLWAWACAEKDSPIQDQFDGVINFKSLCTSQVSPPKTCFAGSNTELGPVEFLALLHCRGRH